MATRQRLRFVVTTVIWSALTIVLLSVGGVFSLELLFVVAFVGLLIVAEMTAPTTVLPAWRVRIRWLVIGGTIILVFIVVRRLVGLLPPSLV